MCKHCKNTICKCRDCNGYDTTKSCTSSYCEGMEQDIICLSYKI